MTSKIRKRIPACQPYLTNSGAWALRFNYKKQTYAAVIGKGDNAKTIAESVAAAIIDDIKNDRFKGSIKPYLPSEKKKRFKPPNPSPKVQVPSNQCLGCGSVLRTRNGKVGGKQNWKCLDCGRQRVEGAAYNFPTGKECYHCGETTIKRGRFKGVQRYLCKNCGSYWDDRNLPEVPKAIDWYNGEAIN